MFRPSILSLFLFGTVCLFGSIQCDNPFSKFIDGVTSTINGIACLNEQRDKIQGCNDMINSISKEDNSPQVCCATIKYQTCVRTIAKVYCKSDALDALDSSLKVARDSVCGNSGDNVWTCLDTVWQVVIIVVAVLVALSLLACIARICRCC